MSSELSRFSQVTYVSSDSSKAKVEFSEAISGYVKDKKGKFSELIVLCIGTDRATGDCLGPLVGQRLIALNANNGNVKIYGSLECPVHAVNLMSVIDKIYEDNENPLIIAVDAALGKSDEHIGYLTVGEGSVKPGASVNKKLPSIGDIFITGIVNTASGGNDMPVIQSTRLNTVMKMARVIADGIASGLDMALASERHVAG